MNCIHTKKSPLHQTTLYTENTLNSAEKCRGGNSQRKREWEKGNKWESENFLCIYFRTWCVCFCSIYFPYSHFLYYRLFSREFFFYFFCSLLCHFFSFSHIVSLWWRARTTANGFNSDEYERLQTYWLRKKYIYNGLKYGINMVLHAIRHAKTFARVSNSRADNKS